MYVIQESIAGIQEPLKLKFRFAVYCLGKKEVVVILTYYNL